ncbi:MULTISPECIES: glutamate ABC transporter substrate-binding protein [Kitasatospora]|uniref:Putative glutamate ABC transporter substrate-binding protein n=1 Tax=Kitasatospora setae (strain ATCC 33774 / DSM 43861 / JCM 3304 / KCC A-0304 / NBRC 14216 / KM-6054) TaxID=452652 RepID=E4NI10_KITSK|nr:MULTISPECIES: glutamate ABC transporter substrate-binding protein [Kitasatospora]BAJ31140.1 putative glutamate ABC transporter substrate-binding protein [Kitasatospora setae KM-6054]
MKARRTVAAALSVLALTAVAACGKDGTPDSDAGKGGSAAPQLPVYQVNAAAKLDASKTWTTAKTRGKLVVGAKSDQPFLGFEDVQTGKRNGFDIEIAKMVAADLGFSADQIEFKTINSSARETSLSGDQIDYYVGTYSITPKRKEQIDFAGPYYIAGQSLLVNKDNTAITGPETTKDKAVCTAAGSTSVAGIQKYGAKVTTFESYSLCVEKLLTKEVDAVTTDDSILKGYAAKNQGQLKVVGTPFSEERYGVGLKKGDAALQKAINDALKKHEDNGDWKKAYDATLGLSGSAAPAVPALDPVS